MKSNIEQPWIEAGYLIFSKEGNNGLKVERIARMVGKNKSSFYHLFADIEIFQKKLLDYHQKRAEDIAERARQCKTLVPDMLDVVLDLKTDLLFNRQLRIYRNNPEFRKCFERANGIVEEGFMGIWAEAFGLQDRPRSAHNLMKMTIDNFYLRITEENISRDWLLSFLYELQFMVKEIQKESGDSTITK